MTKQSQEFLFHKIATQPTAARNDDLVSMQQEPTAAYNDGINNF
ncbi:multidrug transporter [Rickettsia rhipicephali]|uniref:Uncharacterized protein n=1 Tax=Rickettsia rhipicephali str. Ect TaxID=1359199 RepID=A0A0F3PG14_RICRH|nr:multidrug transporter [Rickettsia rhipicephali]KJV79213.1 hypothetical protein RMAECT_1560 [Rickettsia rhipicephali str. Ect]